MLGTLLFTRCILALLMISLTAQGRTINDNTNQYLTMCVSHYPPHQIVLPDQTPTGENIAAATYFFNKLGFSLRFTQNNSFWRCLAMLKAGKVDIMSGLLDAPERREFAHLLAYSALNKKLFYVNKNNLNISTFSDLKGLKVAVLRGIKQFKQFDNAPDGYLKKVYVSDLDAAFRVLVAGKVDVVISTDFFDLDKFKNQANATQEIAEVVVKLDDSSLLFTGLSKKSKVAHLVPKFTELSKVLYKNGEFQKVIDEFKLKHPEYYH